MTFYLESVKDQTDGFADAFVREKLAYSYDVRKITTDAILFREIQSTKTDI